MNKSYIIDKSTQKLLKRYIDYVKNTHLCNSCCQNYPICDGNEIIFGIGVGNDNIIKCDGYMEVHNEKDNK